MMKFELTILGTNAAVPYHNRFLSGQVLNIKEQLFLIDCGEGTQFRLNHLGIKKSKINHIFISHLHGDHFFGLVGVLTSMAMEARKQGLTVWGPKGLEEYVTTIFRLTNYVSPFPITFVLIDHTTVTQLIDNELVEVKSFPLQHRVPTVGYVFKEKMLDRNIKAEKIEAYNIPYSAINAIKKGGNFTNTEGVVVLNDELTIPPPKPRSFAYCSDTAYDETIVPNIRGVDLLYHETTFLHDLAELAVSRGHATALQAGQIAKLAEVGLLVTGHYSSRYDELHVFLDEAKQVFEHVVLGIDGQTYSVDLVKNN